MDPLKNILPKSPLKGPPLPAILDLDWPKEVSEIVGMVHRWVDKRARSLGVARWQFEQDYPSLIEARRKQLLRRLQERRTLLPGRMLPRKSSILPRLPWESPREIR